MAAKDGTLNGNTEFSGNFKIITVTATLANTSDVITLNAADHGGVKSIVAVLSERITSGTIITFTFLRTAVSGLAITVTSFEGDGTVATSFGNIELTLLVAV